MRRGGDLSKPRSRLWRGESGLCWRGRVVSSKRTWPVESSVTQAIMLECRFVPRQLMETLGTLCETRCVILLMGNTRSTQMHTQTLNSFLPNFSKMTGETRQGVYASRCCSGLPAAEAPAHVPAVCGSPGWVECWSSAAELWLRATCPGSDSSGSQQVLYVLGLAGKMLPFLETVFMGFSFSQASRLQQLQKSSKLKE